MGMALFLFSCVLLCWALKPKHRETHAGEKLGGTGSKRPSWPRWGSLSHEEASDQLRAESERNCPAHKGLPKGKSSGSWKEEMYGVKLRLLGPDLCHS